MLKRLASSIATPGLSQRPGYRNAQYSSVEGGLALGKLKRNVA